MGSRSVPELPWDRRPTAIEAGQLEPNPERSLRAVDVVLGLFDACRRQRIRPVVVRLLEEVGGVAGLPRAEAAALRYAGLSDTEARRVRTAVELARRILAADLTQRLDLDVPSKITRYLDLTYSQSDQEVVGALYLTDRNRLIATRELYRGTSSQCTLAPQLILKHAVLLGAAHIVLFQTRPSGNLTFLEEDRLFSERLEDAAKLLGCRLIDHLLLGAPGRWMSLRVAKP